MAVKRGLGRGLDSLIPDRSRSEDYLNKEGNAAEPTKKPAQKKDSDKENEVISQKTPAGTAPSRQKKTPAKETTAKEVKVKETPAKEAAPAQPVVDEKNIVRYVKLAQVEPNREQPRKTFNEEKIDELAASIKEHGVIQPLLVQKKDDYYEIIAGERRWRAARKAGIKELPVIVRDYSPMEVVEISLIENIQREDLNPIEEAQAYRRLLEEFDLTQEQVASKVSRSRSAVANFIRLLNLGNEVQEMVMAGLLSEGQARALLPIENHDVQKTLADQIVKEKLTVRETERLVKSLLEPSARRERQKNPEKEALLKNISEQLRHILGTKVAIKSAGKSRGRIEIEYYSDDELDRLIDLLKNVQ